REDRDAVVRALAMVQALVARGAQLGGGEGFVLALRLLQAGDVGRLRREPVEEVGKPYPERVHVPGGDLHGVDQRGSEAVLRGAPGAGGCEPLAATGSPGRRVRG